MDAQSLRQFCSWQRLIRPAATPLLAVVIASCAAPPSAVNSANSSAEVSAAEGTVPFSAEQAGTGSAGSTSGDRTSNSSSRADAEQRSNRLCDRPEVSLSPLSTPEDAPVFEQFNFQPQQISTTASEVKIDTPYHSFSYCKNTGEWAIANRPRSQEPPFNYAQYLQDLADPGYETIEVNGSRYQYRVRLEAPWIEQQIGAQRKEAQPGRTQAGPLASVDSETNGRPSSKQTGSSPSDNTPPVVRTADGSSASVAEESVYFDLKRPDGSLITRQLYTLKEVQDASIGASLGVPAIARAIETNGSLWFAATTSQGEGENGFASLLHYDLEARDLTVHQPSDIQGDQITSLAATASAAGDLTLWLGTLRSAEGTPFLPASGLVSYQPNFDSADGDGALRQYTIDNSPIVGAIPYEVAAADKNLWVATGNGICQVQWASIEQEDSWRCWQFTATAALPSEGVDLYPSFLAEEPAETLTGDRVEVLWANWEHFDQPDLDKAGAFRYEVAHEKGFEAALAQGGHRIDNKVAQRMARGSDIAWPGQPWHWSGRRFERSLDEVSLNLLGGGPSGLMASNIQTGMSFDHYAIRGDFDLLSLKPEGTRVRYYSGWVEGDALKAYPNIVEVDQPKSTKPNPITSIATDLPPVGP